MSRIIKYLLQLYQKLGFFSGRCRFHPTCSQYAIEAVDRYGVMKGTFLALKRLFRCNQLFPGGFDPVP